MRSALKSSRMPGSTPTESIATPVREIVNGEFQENSMPPISIAVSISPVIRKAMHAVVSVAVILQVNAFARLRVFELGSRLCSASPLTMSAFAN